MSGSSKSTDTSPFSDSSSNSGSREKIPPKEINITPLPRTVDVPRGKNPNSEDDDNFDDFSYKVDHDKDYNSYNFSENI